MVSHRDMIKAVVPTSLDGSIQTLGGGLIAGATHRTREGGLTAGGR